MRRILLLNTDLEIGGTPTVVRELADRLHNPAYGIHVEVACLGKWGPVATMIRDSNIRVTALNARGAWDVGAIFRLIALIRHRHYDTVFSFLVHGNTAAAIAKLVSPKVRFIQALQTAQPKPAWHWTVQSIVQRAAEKVVVPSASVAEVARDWCGVGNERIVVIPNAIEVDETPDNETFPRGTSLTPTLSRREPERTPGGELLPLPPAEGRGEGRPPEMSQVESATSAGAPGSPSGAADAPFKIGFVGRLDPVKRIPDLLHALAILPKRFTLEIWGEGVEKRTIESTIVDLRLTERVTLRTGVGRTAIPTFDALVLCSQAEGFGLVLIEAMNAGVPVIGTNVAGIRDVIKPGKTGLLVPPASPTAIAEAILKLADDAFLRQRLVEAARTDVAERFAWKQVIRQYQKLLGTEAYPAYK